MPWLDDAAAWARVEHIIIQRDGLSVVSLVHPAITNGSDVIIHGRNVVICPIRLEGHGIEVQVQGTMLRLDLVIKGTWCRLTSIAIRALSAIRRKHVIPWLLALREALEIIWVHNRTSVPNNLSPLVDQKVLRPCRVVPLQIRRYRGLMHEVIPLTPLLHV